MGDFTMTIGRAEWSAEMPLRRRKWGCLNGMQPSLMVISR
jgi:hypothetical protein